MTIDQLISAIETAISQYRAEQAAPAPQFVVAQEGEDLQAALNSSTLPVHLVAGATYPGVTLPSGARLVGNGASIVGVGRTALYVAPGSSDIEVSDVTATCDTNGAVVLLGDNVATTQNLSSQVPTGITLTRVRVPTHRGKRGFEINAARVLMVDCEARDVHTTTGQDSTALGVLNSTGDITVRGGVYEGGSECFLSGGDQIKLTDSLGPVGMTFEGVTFTRPPSWQTDGVSRVVKNIFELKNGRQVTVRNCILEQCWKDGQDGYAFMLTPTRMGVVQDVLIEGCTVRNVGGGINITGSDINQPYTTEMWTSGIRVANSTFVISKALYFGPGRFILTQGGARSVEVDGCTVSMDGSSLIYVTGTPLMDRLSVCNSTFNCGSYGFNIAGGANASNWAAGTADLIVTGNTISAAATALKTNLAAIGKTPANTYV